ncbi:MAG: hypothetical protein AB1649_01090 [Chloroflexota bacterium]
MRSSPGQFWRTFLVLSIAVSAIAIYQTQQQTEALLKIRTRYKWVVVMGVFAINFLVGLYLVLRGSKNESIWQRLELSTANALWKVAGIILLVAAFPLYLYARYVFFGDAVPSFFPLLWVWLWLALLQSAGLRLLTRLPWATSFAVAVLLDGIIAQSYFVLQPVTDYPFSLGWSEASRFYYGSLPFSKALYGESLPLSVWHGTRYLLQSIPFLFDHSSLTAARLWQAFLWLALPGLTAFLLVRRLRWTGWEAGWVFGVWFFLFLFQGAVYYHLLVSVIIILAWVSPRNLTKSLVAVGLASFWAGMSRLNWYPVPAMLAIAIYLLEEPLSSTGKIGRYLYRPILYGLVGLLLAFAGQAFYIVISGNQDLTAFGSSFTSALLWYRWWPSDTNPLGVIPGILLVSLPLIGILYWLTRGKTDSLHPLRLLGLTGMLVILLAGGLVVSTKIGGGGDLHNMDAYIVLLGLITAYFMSQRVAAETGRTVEFEALPWSLIALLLVVPVAFSLSRLLPPIQYNRAQAAEGLSTLREAVQLYGQEGPVLFIYERHLLTFKMIRDVPVIPEYEVVTLTEMAISGNQAYLERFYGDLENHRFAAIVARKQNLDVNIGEFAEESETWNRLVAYPLLCEYEPVLTLNSSNIQVLVPRAVVKCPIIEP